MANNQSDIYSPLYRWARRQRQGENFTTTAFVFLVNLLKDRDVGLFRRFMSWLCFERETEFQGDLPSVKTHDRFPRRASPGTPDGLSDAGQAVPAEDPGYVIPDIYVKAKDVFCLVEVKVGSGLGPIQLGEYLAVLETHSEFSKRRLILLTAFQPSYDSDKSDKVRPVRWSEVVDWFECERNARSEPVAAWLVTQFLSFLKGIVIMPERVDWQYVGGVKALSNLVNMLEKALRDEKLDCKPGKAASGYVGFNTNDNRFWIGIYLDEPQLLYFQFYKATPDVKKLLLSGGWLEHQNGYAKTLDLSSEPTCFFARSRDNQLEELKKFVKGTFETACGCVAAAQTNPATTPSPS